MGGVKFWRHGCSAIRPPLINAARFTLQQTRRLSTKVLNRHLHTDLN